MNHQTENKSTLPFELVRRRGFLYRHGGFTKVQETLDDALNRDRLPVVLAGPRGAGKTTLIKDWFGQHVSRPINLRRLKASHLKPARVADAILTAYGMAPDHGAGALDALGDFVDDQRSGEGLLVVVVTDLDEAENTAADDLASLTKGIAQGGVRLPLIATWNGDLPAVHPLQLSQRVHLAPLDRSDIRGFVDAVYAQADLSGWSFSKGAFSEMLRLSGGLPGRLGELIDDVHRSAVQEHTQTIKRKLVRQAERAPSAEVSPADIEAALASLDGDGEAAPAAKALYPRIEPADVALQQQSEPANDAHDHSWDEAAVELEEMVEEALALEDAVAALKLEVLELRKRLTQRGQSRLARDQAFVAALRNRGPRDR